MNSILRKDFKDVWCYKIADVWTKAKPFDNVVFQWSTYYAIEIKYLRKKNSKDIYQDIVSMLEPVQVMNLDYIKCIGWKVIVIWYLEKENKFYFFKYK